MDSRIISKIKSKAKNLLKNKEVLDVIVFGSAVKGKSMPNDIDLAVISEKYLTFTIDNFHIIQLKPSDFFANPPGVINTLLREGYSLKNNKSFSEVYHFLNKVLFTYSLTGLNPSLKVKVVNALRGKKEGKGLVEENNGKWLANQVFFIPVENEHIFEKLFINFKMKFSKYYVLMH